MTRPSRRPLAVGLVVAALITAVAFALAPVRSDLSDLLPEGGTTASRLMLREVRTGAAASLVLAGIEGAPEAELAAISERFAHALAGDPTIAFVENGRALLTEADVRALFARRYLLSSASGPSSFDTPALRAAFQRVLEGLESSASPLVGEFGLADPTGAFSGVLAAWSGGSLMRVAGGVWFDAARPRALLLLRLRVAGMELGGQATALDAIERAFAMARQDTAQGEHPARLLLAGPAVFARDVARDIQADVRLLSVASIALVAGLLVWRFRSPWVLAAIAIPVLLGIAAAVAVTAWRFGFVHGITLGFGMTMLGVTVDYPVLLIGHRKQSEAASGTWARIGATFALAVATAAIGLSGMALSGVGGVAQLGLFAVTGLLVAAAATRLVLPRLIVAAGLAPVSAGDPALLHRVERWRRHRAWALLPVGLAGLFLIWRGGPGWHLDLASLTPIPAASLALDAELRGALGAPEPGQLILLRGASAEDMLRAEEKLLPDLDRLIGEGAITGAELAARLLPSASLQRERQRGLPNAETLASRVAAAAVGLPFAANAFRPFLDDVAASRAMEPVLPGDVSNPVLATRLAALLAPRDDGWIGIVAPLGLRAPDRFAALAAGAPGAVFVDIGREAAALVSRQVRAAGWRLAGGGIAAVLCLTAVLRDGRVIRVLAALAAALVVTVAILSAAGVGLSLIHLVALQFVAGVGLDYALFFARRQVDEEERARTLRTLVTCAVMAMLTFGLLGACRTPLLAAIGQTVALGVAAAMCFAFLFAGPKPRIFHP